MLEAQKIGKHKDMSESDKEQAGQKLQLLWCVPGLQWSVTIKSGPVWTSDRMIDGKAKMMHVGSEGWPDACGVIWSSRWATIAQITE